MFPTLPCGNQSPAVAADVRAVVAGAQWADMQSTHRSEMEGLQGILQGDRFLRFHLSCLTYLSFQASI